MFIIQLLMFYYSQGMLLCVELIFSYLLKLPLQPRSNIFFVNVARVFEENVGHNKMVE